MDQPLRTLCSHALETLTLALALFKWNPARLVVVRKVSESWVGFLKPKQPEGQRSATVQTAFLGSSVIPFLSDGRRPIALNLLDFASNLLLQKLDRHKSIPWFSLATQQNDIEAVPWKDTNQGKELNYTWQHILLAPNVLHI